MVNFPCYKTRLTQGELYILVDTRSEIHPTIEAQIS